jgi:hypothetical protein
MSKTPKTNFGDISAHFCSAALGKDVFNLLLFPDNYKDIALLKACRGIGYNFDRFPSSAPIFSSISF